jgi:sortase A
VNRRKIWAATLAVVGVCCTIQGGWIHAKAALAQVLLERAWSETAGGRGPTRPWPWADTHPVGRLQVPAHGVDLVVLAGATGRPLAVAPGHLSGSAEFGAPGNAVVAGHRDTHFAFLKHLRTGEEIRTESVEGLVQTYRVIGWMVRDERDATVLDRWGPSTLTLITCFPFDTPIPGGPLRYVVEAESVDVAL